MFDPDPERYTFVLLPIAMTMNWKFNDAVTTSDGRVVFVPCHADAVGIYDPSDSTTALHDISSTIAGDYKFSGGALAGNGKIYFAPFNANGNVTSPVLSSFLSFPETRTKCVSETR